MEGIFMNFKIMDFSEFHKDNIAMSREEWNKARGEAGAMGLTNERVMQVYWEGMVWTDGFPDCLRGLPKDNVVVGALVSDYYGHEKPLHPGRSVCLYWSIDSDGTGSSSSDVYVHMYCVPFENK